MTTTEMRARTILQMQEEINDPKRKFILASELVILRDAPEVAKAYLELLEELKRLDYIPFVNRIVCDHTEVYK